MFTGIIEETGTVQKVSHEGNNLRLTVFCTFSGQLRPDQSLAHNGVCLTVVSVKDALYEVVCVEETLRRSTLGNLQPGSPVNLERSLAADGRIDGHFVQGHVDETGTVAEIRDANGSHEIWIRYNPRSPHLTVDKGSVCVNGVSLTIAESREHAFSVVIIPYTWEHTTFRFLKAGDVVNLEFDILGKYIQKLAAKKK
jgi:riboflavin synthase